jgi:hypothetical protein
MVAGPAPVRPVACLGPSPERFMPAVLRLQGPVGALLGKR